MRIQIWRMLLLFKTKKKQKSARIPSKFDYIFYMLHLTTRNEYTVIMVVVEHRTVVVAVKTL